MNRYRATRRDFLRRWCGGTLLGLGGSALGSAAAYELYRTSRERGLRHLDAGQSRALYPDQVASTAVPAAPRPGGDEPPLFVAAAPVTPPPAAATKPLWVMIPAIDLRSQCVELTTQVVGGQLVWKTADHAVGHQVGTAMPGEPGNCVMSGHISSPLTHQGHVFQRLPELATKLNSDIEIIMQGGAHIHYRVAGTLVVSPADTWVMNPTPVPILTLLTCVPDHVYTHRLVVTSRLVS